MLKWLKHIFLSVIVLAGLLALISACLIFFVDTSAYKSPLEKAVSGALGMEVSIGGRLGIGLFPALHVMLENVSIRNRGINIASSPEADIDIALRPLLSKEIRIIRVWLKRPVVFIRRELDGTFNFQKREKNEVNRSVPRLHVKNLNLSQGDLHYWDERSRERYTVKQFNLNVINFQIADGNSTEYLKNISLAADFAGQEILINGVRVSDVKFACKGENGIFIFNPIRVRLFGGYGAGSIRAAFSNHNPRYFINLSLSKFRIDEYLKTISAKEIAKGAMDFSINLTAQGRTVKVLKQTAGGKITLRGENLMLFGSDLDREISRFESSQNFNLVDVGALFFSGPAGLAITKGYNFAGIFRRSGGASSVRRFHSDWDIKHGIANANDVALATHQNRIAIKGRINLVNERIEEATIALLDAHGCAMVKQKIYGPLRKPVVEKPNVVMALTGPVLNLFRQAKNLFMDGKCEVFYAGSVAAPK